MTPSHNKRAVFDDLGSSLTVYSGDERMFTIGINGWVECDNPAVENGPMWIKFPHINNGVNRI